MKKKRKNNNSYEYLKHFDDIVGTNTRNNIRQMPLFDVFYERFADDFYIQRKEIQDLITKRRITSDKLEETFIEEQQKLFEEYWDLDSQIAEDLRKQLFLFGYITATELFIETGIKGKKLNGEYKKN